MQIDIIWSLLRIFYFSLQSFNFTLRINNVRFDFEVRFSNLKKYPIKNPAPMLQATALGKKRPYYLLIIGC